MTSKLIDVQILKIEGSGKFWAKEAPGQHMSDEAQEFKQLSLRMNEYFDNEESGYIRVTCPVEGQVCVGRRSCDKKWYRVRVQNVYVATHGNIAHCFLVDYAENVQINCINLRVMPESFLTMPYQARLFVLDGICPVTMVTDPESIETTLQPSKTWDPSAEAEIKKLFKDATHRQAELIRETAEKEISVKLFIDLPSRGRTCLNDYLVDKQFATYTKDFKIIPASQPLEPVNTPSPTPVMSKAEPNLNNSKVGNPDYDDYHSYSSSDNDHFQKKPVKVNYKPPGKISLYPKKVRIPSPENKPGPPQLTTEPISDNLVQPQSMKPIGRSSLALQQMQSISSDRKPGQFSLNNLAHSQKSSTGTISLLSKIKLSETSVIGRGSQIFAETSVIGRGSQISPKSTIIGRGSLILNKHTEGKFNNTSPLGQGRPLKPDITEIPDDEQFEDCGESDNNTGNRSRTPSSVRFSSKNKVKILDPSRPDITPPSHSALPTRSILKKSPSLESPTFRDNDSLSDSSYTNENRTKWKQSIWSGGSESDSVPEIPDSVPFKPKGQVTGTMLLECLKSPEMYPKKEEEANPDLDKVVFYGPMKPKCIARVEDLPFGQLILRVESDTHKLRPTKLAQYCFNPIIRGLHTVGVAAVNSKWNIQTYLFPIVHQLHQRENYKDLPKGFGPMALIISPSWEKAQAIYDECKKIINKSFGVYENYKRLRTTVIFSGDNDNEYEMELVNGCEILVATPHCLIRMLQRDATSLSRVCHLVFDDADILTEEFTKQMQDIMLRMKQEQSNCKDRSSPKQILAFGTTWNPSLGVFCRIHMTSPTVVIPAPTEASLFGRVKMSTVQCEVSERVDHLLALLDGSVRNSGKTVIFVNDDKDADNLNEILKARSLYTMTANSMVQMSLEEVQRDWLRPHKADSQPILVVTDEAFEEMPKIMDATTVIHFDPPVVSTVTLKWSMGKRLWCLRKAFANPIVEKKPQSKSHCYIFVTPGLGSEAQNIERLLKRTYNQVPELLGKISENHMKRIEKNKSVELCSVMKAFGKCRDEKRCRKSRHVVFNSLDSPGKKALHINLPTNGSVQVLITHVKNASCYYVRLLQHTADGKVTPMNMGYPQLVMSMNMFYGSSKRRKKCGIPEVNKLYALEDAQHTFHRVETKDMSKVGNHGIREEAMVFFVDIGKTEIIHTKDLYELDASLYSEPFQAVEIYLCRVRPLDNDTSWTGRSTAFMSNLIFNKTLDGVILLTMGNTLWVDTLVEKVKLKEVNVVNTLYNVKSQLIQNHYGEENNQHVHMLLSACYGRLDLPEGLYNPENSATMAYTVYGKPIEIPVESLSTTRQFDDEIIFNEDSMLAADNYVEVYVSAIESPDLIYLQPGKTFSAWKELQNDIKESMQLTELVFIEDLRKGTLVLAKFPLEDEESDGYRWYRGKIMDFEDNKVDIFFVDTGEQELVEREFIQPLKQQFLNLPFQAVECGIMHLEAIDNNWPEEVSDYIYDITRTPSDYQPKPIYAKVVLTTNARHTGKHKYGVELQDISMEYTVNIGAHLVSKGMANISENYVQEMFPHISDNVMQSYRTVPVICRTILQVQDSLPRQKLCTEMLQVIQENTDHIIEMGQHGVIECLFTLLQYVREVCVVDSCCTALTLLSWRFVVGNLSLIEQRVFILCDILDNITDHDIQGAVLDLIFFLTKSDIHHIGIKYVVLEKGGARILSKVLNSSQSSQICEKCIKTLNVLVDEKQQLSSETLSIIIDSGCIPAACKCVRRLYDDDTEVVSLKTAKQCVRLFETLAKHVGMRDTLRKQGALKELCAVLGDPKTDHQLLDICIRTLDLMSSNNRFNKDKMVELNMVNVLNRLNEIPKLPISSKLMCQTLKERLEAMKKSQVRPTIPEYVANGHVNNDVDSDKENVPDNSDLCNRLQNKVHHIQGVRLLCPEIPVRSATPDVIWAQSKWSILLSVQVRGVTTNDKVARFDSHNVSFNAVADATEYSFNFDLYELIVPEKCEIKVLGSVVQLGLNKAVKGRWPRLTKKKSKLSYLKVDYDRFIDSDSEDDGDDGEVENDNGQTEEVVEKPLALAQRNNQRYKPFSLAGDDSGSKKLGVNPDLVMDDSNSESDSSDNLDDGRPYRDGADNEHFGL